MNRGDSVKVAIIGYTPTRKDAPYKDKSWEIWGLNDLYKFKAEDDVQRWDRWFEMHEPSLKGNDERHSFDQRVAEFNKWKCPVYMQAKHPEVPTSIEYPLATMIEQYGNYFTNSISYMIALAIHEGAKEIGIYGVDMSTSEEYGSQRPSVEYYLGIAKGKGIKLDIHPACDLLKARFLYGYETEKENLFLHKIGAVTNKMKQDKAYAEQQAREAEKVAWQYDGAITAYEYVKTLWDMGDQE